MAENPGDDVGATLLAHAPAPVGANARNTRAEMTKHQRRRPPRSTTSWLVSGAETANFAGATASELKRLIDGNTIRVFDAVMITRADDGSGEATEMREADASEIGESRALERDRDPARRGGHQRDRRIACPRRGRRRSAGGAPVRRRAAGERPNLNPGADSHRSKPTARPR